MTVPKGYHFTPTDQELLIKYLDKKCTNEALPCDVVIDREIYGDKAPWQIFTDEDPWEISKTKDKKTDLWKTEGTIYVFTTLIKASQNRIARKAGCGSWHGETAREEVKNGKCAIGYKTTLYFEIAADEPIAMDGPVEKGHWIMQEYSLRDGNTDKSTSKYVLCRIKRFDSKYTKVSPRKRKNVEAANDDLVVSKPAKRVRTEVIQEKKMEYDITSIPDTEVVPFSKDQQFVQDQIMNDDANELTVEELEAIWEQEEQENYSPWHSVMFFNALECRAASICLMMMQRDRKESLCNLILHGSLCQQDVATDEFGGNHDINGMRLLRGRQQQSKFQIISANSFL
ncbi:NAC transcription factor 29-like [Rhododendron vialii]|uniref:NAC transcription factor 29-like n=1 Tax=Rhododendron vialii TaxID=182163 RepID=UPI00265FA8DE|nr:NAC transcription factor 29-like [Rhododendron vialii]